MDDNVKVSLLLLALLVLGIWAVCLFYGLFVYLRFPYVYFILKRIG